MPPNLFGPTCTRWEGHLHLNIFSFIFFPLSNLAVVGGGFKNMQILIDLNSKYLFRIPNPLDHILHPPPNVVWSNIRISPKTLCLRKHISCFSHRRKVEGYEFWRIVKCTRNVLSQMPRSSWKRFREMVIVGTGSTVYISQNRAQNPEIHSVIVTNIFHNIEKYIFRNMWKW